MRSLVDWYHRIVEQLAALFATPTPLRPAPLRVLDPAVEAELSRRRRA
jgi:hypothetical protein